MSLTELERHLLPSQLGSPVSTRVIIAISPRCGSTFFCSLLEETGAFREIGEFLNPRGPIQMYRERFNPRTVKFYLDAIQNACSGPDGLFGLKAAWLDFEPISNDVNLLLPNSHYIQIKRQDLAAQALSLYRAITTDFWHKRRGTEAPPLPRLDLDKALKCLKNIVLDIRGWERFFSTNGITPLELSYEEDILKDPAMAVAIVMRHCGITEFKPVLGEGAPFEKIGSAEDPDILAISKAALQRGLLRA
jgi:LPS sulfotransferase NodH